MDHYIHLICFVLRDSSRVNIVITTNRVPSGSIRQKRTPLQCAIILGRRTSALLGYSGIRSCNLWTHCPGCSQSCSHCSSRRNVYRSWFCSRFFWSPPCLVRTNRCKKEQLLPVGTRQVSSMIHSARPTVPPVAITILIGNDFVFNFKYVLRTWWKIVNTTDCDCGPASWIKGQ